MKAIKMFLSSLTIFVLLLLCTNIATAKVFEGFVDTDGDGALEMVYDDVDTVIIVDGSATRTYNVGNNHSIPADGMLDTDGNPGTEIILERIDSQSEEIEIVIVCDAKKRVNAYTVQWYYDYPDCELIAITDTDGAPGNEIILETTGIIWNEKVDIVIVCDAKKRVNTYTVERFGSTLDPIASGRVIAVTDTNGIPGNEVLYYDSYWTSTPYADLQFVCDAKQTVYTLEIGKFFDKIPTDELLGISDTDGKPGNEVVYEYRDGSYVHVKVLCNAQNNVRDYSVERYSYTLGDYPSFDFVGFYDIDGKAGNEIVYTVDDEHHIIYDATQTKI